MFQEQFEELKHTGKLPSPSGVGLRLLMLLREDDCSVDDVAVIIQSDPALSGRILKMANAVSQFRGVEVGTVRDAAMRLGLKAVCNVGLGFSLVSGNRSGSCTEFDYEGYWASSLALAQAAQKLSVHTGTANASEVFSCALLSRIGRLALASVHPVEYAEVLVRSRRETDLGLAHVEREHFAIDNREVSAALLTDWGLPGYFSEVALCFDGGPPPPNLEHSESAACLRILNSSSLIAEICLKPVTEQPALWPKVEESAAGLGVSGDDLATIYDSVVEETREWCHSMRVPLPTPAKGKEIEGRQRMAQQVQEVDDLAKASLRILAVDDDPVSLRLLVAHLMKAGHEVMTAKNGMEALGLALEWNPQMVVTDWMMPEMDGLELCKRLRSTDSGRNLYILVLTGRAEEERIVEAFEAGADDYIVKPFSPRLLMARIRPGIRVILLQEENERHLREKQQKNAKLEIAKRKLKAAAMTDALTELPNRRYAMKRLEKEWANSSRSGNPMSAIMLDIDHFKAVNDNHGHDVGDIVLRATAQAIHRSLRRGDTCARMGGEEFLVICPNTDLEGAAQLADRIRSAVEENRIRHPGFDGRVTASLGVGYRSAGVLSIDALLKMADQAVYQAKREGRNRVVVGFPEGHRKSA